MSGAVKDQYQALPCLPRDVALEKERLRKTLGDSLLEINHYCFEWHKAFKEGLNHSVAGGGAVDAASI